jgi:lipid-binding SYLF domain-containing protein
MGAAGMATDRGKEATVITMKRAILVLLVLVLVLPGALAADKKEEKAAKQQAKRQDIDRMAKETLDELLGESGAAKELYDKAFGYAVFSNYKFQLILAGGGGQGVAVEKGPGNRTYMKMGTGGIGLGIGGKKYSLVFLFQNEASFRNFVDKGWQADTQAGAAAGTASADVESTFTKGVAYYQITEKGLIASADISGTKYWKNDKLNQ